MGRPAVPKYLDKHVLRDDKLEESISPGQRFGLFFPYWDPENWGADSQDKSKTNALRQVLPLSQECRELLKAIISRQEAAAETVASPIFKVYADSSAPFMTGIGNEHPLENGFSFLNPYGLPYLPGSAVKGIVRRAAEDLCTGQFGDDGGWQPLYVWLLFGFDAGSGCLAQSGSQNLDPVVSEIAESRQRAYQDGVKNGRFDGDALRAFLGGVLPRELATAYADQPARFFLELGGFPPGQPGAKAVDRKDIHYQGALSFWDVFPIPSSGSSQAEYLRIDILTPHYGDYYQGTATPADCGQPVPNPFLTVAPGCRFTFHVQCETARLPESLQGTWLELLSTAFRHAFDWLGFGAKTAVGYGQMSCPETAETRREMVSSALSAAPGPAPAAPRAKDLETWDKALLSWNKGAQTLTATHPDGKRKTAPWKQPDRAKIPESLHQALFEAKKPKPVHAKVTVSVKGNDIRIEAIEYDV